MYPNSNALSFPSLVRDSGQEANLNAKEPGSATVPLYRLDWRDFEEAKVRAYKDWLTKVEIPEAQNIPHIPLTNILWETRLDGLQFAITESYGQEIWRLTQLAQAEWGRPLPFQRNIREKCQDTAVAAIYLIFYLLADCIWESIRKTEGKWARGYDTKKIYQVAMLVRFWDRQASENQIGSYALVDDLLAPGSASANIPDFQVFRDAYKAQRILREQMEAPIRTCPQRSISGGPWETKIRDTDTWALRELRQSGYHTRGFPVIEKS